MSFWLAKCKAMDNFEGLVTNQLCHGLVGLVYRSHDAALPAYLLLAQQAGLGHHVLSDKYFSPR
jgi:hypothetical protein